MPMERGILATIYGKIKDQRSKVKINELIQLYKEFYKGKPFVRIYENGEPCTKFVAGTNYCDIGVSINQESETIIVMSAIDNLVKGAAGQAVQNLNLISGFEETAGLKQIALYP
jgi:N-acetyl-gamma-glutamyl-phosphate reductase